MMRRMMKKTVPEEPEDLGLAKWRLFPGAKRRVRGTATGRSAPPGALRVMGDVFLSAGWAALGALRVIGAVFLSAG
jgi:hypothetical protein